jgi:energy-coupling factor transporter ATP-binding protein EcfA2
MRLPSDIWQPKVASDTLDARMCRFLSEGVRITRIILQNFRAFDAPFGLDLDGGKNLLLHGENGSGKSSIYLALKRFFEERGDDIAKHRNHFSPENRAPSVRIHIKGRDATGADHDQDFCWDITDGHPLPVPPDPAHASVSPTLRSLLVDGARRAGFLDYRAMLRMHLISNSLPRSHRGPAIHDIIYGDLWSGSRRIGGPIFRSRVARNSRRCSSHGSRGR